MEDQRNLCNEQRRTTVKSIAISIGNNWCKVQLCLALICLLMLIPDIAAHQWNNALLMIFYVIINGISYIRHISASEQRKNSSESR